MSQIQTNTARLLRAYLPQDQAVLGELVIGAWRCCTLELPWRANRPNVSCIPEGQYPLRLRPSPIVKRTSGGKFEAGWEICDVPGRKHIMFHPGNFPRDTEGCILPGAGIGWLRAGPMVTESRNVFDALMLALSTGGSWEIEITTRRPQDA